MPSTFGTALRVTVFGQSHSAGMGCVMEGLPSGFKVDLDALDAFMARRAPGNAPWTTPRKEADSPRILSGLNPDGRTCGAPLAAVIENTSKINFSNVSLLLALYDADGVKAEETFANTSSWAAGEKVRFEAGTDVNAAQVKVSVSSYDVLK